MKKILLFLALTASVITHAQEAVITANAGDHASACGNSFYNLLYQNATASGGTVSWSSSGDGWFQYLTGSGPYTDLSPLYHLGPADRTNGSAIITLTVTGDDNSVTTDSFTLTLVPPPTAIIDPIIVNPWDELHVCTGGSYSFSNAVVAEGANIYWYSTGDGSFNNDGIQNPIYTPGPQDIANGYVNIRLNVSSYGETFCDNRVSVRLVIDPIPAITASAGTNGSISSPGVTTMSCDGTEDKTYTITPAAGYLISDVTVDGISATALTTGSYATGGTYEFIDVQGDHTISVTFALACTNVGLADAMATASSICADATTTLTYSGLTGTNASVTWTQFEDGTGMTYGTGITSNQVGPGTYYAYATGDCGSPVYRAVTVATTPQATPTFTQVEPVCSGATMETLVTLSNNGIEGTWSPALNNLETTEYTFTPTEGQCANTATMTITVMPNVLYYADTDGDGFGNPAVSQQSCSGAPSDYVTNNTDCDDTDAGIYPNSTKTIPIGLLTGVNVICNGTTVTYTIDPVANATSYQWTLPTGATGTSTSTSIAVTFGSTYTAGDLCVQAVNGDCLSATTCLTITPTTAVPATPGVITGPVAVAPNTTKTYTIASVAKATSYVWTTPANATLVSGQGTTSATFDFGAGFTTGLIAVKANNCKGNSATRSLTVKKVGLSAVRAAQCGATLTAINATIYANTITGATKYRFEVSNGSTVQTYETTNYYFNLTQLEIMPSFSTAYSIKLAILFDTIWQEYGAPCLVTTPAAPLTKVQDTQCGKVLTALNVAIVANAISGATNYRFKIVNGASTQTIETASRWFYLKSLTGGGLYSTAYTISVATKSNGVWGEYGDACMVTTPGPTTKVQASQCGTTLATLSTAIVANSVTGATNYRFKVVNGTTTRYAETVSRWFYLKSLIGGGLYSTAYTISVAVKYNGVWANYGDECIVTTPSAPLTRPVDLTTVTEPSTFIVTGYPNPYTNTFKLDITTQSSASIEVRVYDMIGKLIEVRNSGVAELGQMEIGDRYATGVYNVIVTQGTEVKTVRMIKK